VRRKSSKRFQRRRNEEVSEPLHCIVSATKPGRVATDSWDRQTPKIQYSPWQLLLSTSCNETTGVYGKSTARFCELPCKQTSWRVRWPQEATVAQLALVPGCGQEERYQYIGLCASLILFNHPQCSDQCCCQPLASIQWIAIAFRIFVFSVSFIVFCMLYAISV